MDRQRITVSADTELRAFYAACGLDPKTIEGAIKARHQEPTVFVNRIVAGKLAAERARKKWKRKVKR